jgi:hypothetical protein
MYRHIALGPNVRNSFLMLAEMERRGPFRTYIDAKYVGDNKDHQADTMPGIHGGINELTGFESEAAQLVLSRALRFLKANGSRFAWVNGENNTKFNGTTKYILDKNGDSPSGTLAMYSKIMLRIEDYKGHAQSYGEKDRKANVLGPKATWATSGHQLPDPLTSGRDDHHGLNVDEAFKRMHSGDPNYVPYAQRTYRFFANQEHQVLLEHRRLELRDMT